MRTKIFFIVVFWSFMVFGQSQKDLLTIDSLHLNISSLKASDSAQVAINKYQIAEIYRYASKSDSAYRYYQSAEKIFRDIENKYFIARTLFGIAVIQTNEKDYTGSEVTSIEAISLLESLEETNGVNKYKAYIFNNLGIIFDELGQYEEAVDYYNKSLELKGRLKGDFSRSIYNTQNNLADSYSRNGNYNLAIEKYLEILSNDDLFVKYPMFYALVINNYAHTLYLSNKNEELPNLFFRALRISDSIEQGSYNSIIIHQHLAEYYNHNNQKDSAIYFAYRAKNISENYANDDLLKSLMILSKVEEGEKAAEHLKAYVRLSDSLQKAERKIRNKFARIRFETQQIEQDNIRIARERMWLIVISIILLIAGALIYIIISQRAKNKELRFAKQQQEANEEIYNLMLGEHEKVEEARATEKQRISQELHDGVLGRLFGTRLSLDSLNMNNSEEAIKTRGQYIVELKTIEDDIRKVSHELNTDFVSGAGFVDIIKSMVETQTAVYKLDYDLHHDDDVNWDGVGNKSKIHIYRILQESLHNIHKHANATYIIISIKLENNVICLTVEDNGSGFDVNKSKSGIGVKNMNARIKEVDGTINIKSEINKGTIVSIEVPTQYL